MIPSLGVCLLSKQILFVVSLHENFPPKAPSMSNRSSLGGAVKASRLAASQVASLGHGGCHLEVYLPQQSLETLFVLVCEISLT